MKLFKLTLLLLLVFFNMSCGNEILEKKYELDYDPNHEIDLVIPKKDYKSVKIRGHILFYGHNTDFILINQKPRDSIYSWNEKLKYDEMMDKIFKTYRNYYWIISLTNTKDSIYGPLHKEKYLALRKTLSIPDTLKLNHSTLRFFSRGDRKDIEYKDLDPETIDIENLKGNDFFD